jgi:L-2-hydroxyglutarate oxidase LhgO
MKETNVLIIGGGITGLSAGAFLEDSEYLIIE